RSEKRRGVSYPVTGLPAIGVISPASNTPTRMSETIQRGASDIGDPARILGQRVEAEGCRADR
ncbi:MAG: hypothetical protein AAGB10_19945, partial [Pseudomonadota bacterium]